MKTSNIEEYKEGYRKLYYEEGIFQNKKSRDFL